ncbi:Hypothetical predicted protein [Lecanosticta acicola]|uniref:J domain-containing protein n=1 Tax=Lecanosticta acicola TaxID=111012 RepID=A0AAI8Z8Q4_9PEZI|nr:Hypothetical predicted protein [Lecanosticta acicola]
MSSKPSADAPSKDVDPRTDYSRTPLADLYIQLDQDDPADVLGINWAATETEIYTAFRSLALRIHPDKAPSEDLKQFHTLLFQILKPACETLLVELRFGSGHARTQTHTPPKALPETWEALHARNWDNKERLKAERAKAARVVRAGREYSRKKSEKMFRRMERQKELCIATAMAQETKRKQDFEKRRRTMPKPGQKASIIEVEEDTAARGRERRMLKNEKKAMPSRSTARMDISCPMFDLALDETPQTEADIQHRWNRQLLSGGVRTGSVSLEEKKRRDNNDMARTTREQKSLHESAKANSAAFLRGDRPSSFMEYDAIAESIYDMEIEIEANVEEDVEARLRLEESEIRKQYLLPERGNLRTRQVELGMLFIEN